MRWAAVLAVFVALTCSAPAVAASQPPSPSSGNAQREHKPATTNRRQGGQDHIGAPPPSSPIVQIQRTKNENSIAAEPHDESHWYANPDWWIAGFTGALFLATTGLWVFTGLMWQSTVRALKDEEAAVAVALNHVKESGRAASAMEEANKLNREIFVSSERAWLFPNVSIASPLTYDPVNNGALRIDFHISVRNVGRSPAINAHVQTELVIPAIGKENFLVAPIQVRISERARARRTDFFDQVVFPSGEVVYPIGHIVSREELDRVTSVSQSMIPTLVGCVDYQFPFGPDHHQTWFSFYIQRRLPNGRLSGIDRASGDIPSDELMLSQAFTSKRHAD